MSLNMNDVDPRDVDEPGDYSCPYCGGDSFVLGTLGMMLHLRCRNCGGDFSMESPDLQDEPDTDY